MVSLSSFWKLCQAVPALGRTAAAACVSDDGGIPEQQQGTARSDI